MTQVPIAEGVFTWSSESPRLLGSRCDDCGTHTFPAQRGCPRCGSESMARVELADRGTLYAFAPAASVRERGIPASSERPIEPVGDGDAS